MLLEKQKQKEEERRMEEARCVLIWFFVKFFIQLFILFSFLMFLQHQVKRA